MIDGRFVGLLAQEILIYDGKVDGALGMIVLLKTGGKSVEC